MTDGFAENGTFYYGAREPKVGDFVKADINIAATVGSYDPDEPDEINARRFFGFTDYEEIDIFVLRSRRHDRRGQRHTDYYYLILLNEAK